MSEPIQRYGIAALTLVFGAIGLLSTLTPDGSAGSPVRQVAVIALSATTVPVAYLVTRVPLGSVWWSKEASIKGINTAFVVYADLGFAAALATYQDPTIALFMTALFAVISGYVAHYVKRPALIFHVVVTTVVIACFGFLVWLDGTPITTVVLMVTVSAVASLGLLAFLWMYTIGSQHTLQTQLTSASTDSLTGLLNRRGFRYRASALIRRTGGPFVLVVIDIDHYKRINDLYGHTVGDVVLQRVADLLRQCAGDGAVIGRLGGDEFAVATIATHTEAIDLLETIRRRSEGLLSGQPVTMSMGVVAHTASDRPPGWSSSAIVDDAMIAADRALFRAKAAGRDTYSVIEAPPHDRTPFDQPASEVPLTG
ncbi:GGDEF domain-containing protein [Gordonia insulae]|uniref:GGDEF domain-containing protein n=1 Tax=Gordonia insulae TaxID=2420509 RepID=UPI0013DDDF50|nr:GGDEF domain-containing protein [Gordonia insulae]